MTGLYCDGVGWILYHHENIGKWTASKNIKNKKNSNNNEKKQNVL